MPVFVTSCHACFVACHAYFVVLPRLFSQLRVTPVSWFYHTCFSDFLSRLFLGLSRLFSWLWVTLSYLLSWTVFPDLFLWLRVTSSYLSTWIMCPRLLFTLCQFLYRKQVFNNNEFSYLLWSVWKEIFLWYAKFAPLLSILLKYKDDHNKLKFLG